MSEVWKNCKSLDFKILSNKETKYCQYLVPLQKIKKLNELFKSVQLIRVEK